MFSTVIFDMDGVVVDSHPVHKQSWRFFLQSLGKEIRDEDLDFVLEGRTRSEILVHYLGDLDEEQLKEYGKRKEAVFQEHARDMKAMPGVERLLSELASQGIVIGLASSGSRARVVNSLTQLGLRDYFGVLVTGDDVVRGKPDPTIFLEAACRLGVPSSEVVVIEDSPSGVSAARAAGMKCVGIEQNGRRQLLLDNGASMVIAGFETLTFEDLLRVHASH